jgi:hypothetical protein
MWIFFIFGFLDGIGGMPRRDGPQAKRIEPRISQRGQPQPKPELPADDADSRR